ncbi:MAG TPA: DUF367 family protein [Nitrososphaerales archaeon]|nr:DUF367 family protein [Nitrososphaerales archaeon]
MSEKLGVLSGPGVEIRAPRIYTIEMRQDDPAKCTSAKMRRMGLARPMSIRSIPKGALVLNPAAEDTLSKADRQSALSFGIVVIDCSWAKAQDLFARLQFRGHQRRLPALLAGNPTNYSKIGALSSLEAVAASLYILGFSNVAKKLLSIYKWGGTFLTLNQEPLDEYSRAESAQQVTKIERSYFPNSQEEHL